MREKQREAGWQADCRRETDGRTQKFQKRGKYGLQNRGGLSLGVLTVSTGVPLYQVFNINGDGVCS